MRGIVKRILLVANVLLLLLVSYLAVTILTNRSKEIAMPKVIDTCGMIVIGVQNGTLTHDQAAEAAMNIFAVGDYRPNIRVFEQNDNLFMETDDPSLTGVSGSDTVEFNCSELQGS